MAANDQRLAEIRRALDAIDEELHALLKRRATFAPEVIQAKGGLGPFWRPAREAQILRRRLGEHSGHFPPASIARIWCEIICGMISMETHFRLATWAPPGNHRVTELIRDYFGQVVPVTREASADAALFAAAADHDVAAVLPWPDDAAAGPWWVQLAERRITGLSIVWRLPFVQADDGPSAALVSRIPLEPSGEDRTLVALQLEGERDPTLGPDTTVLARYGQWRLVEISGFLHAGEDATAALHSGAALKSVVIGAYAVPVEIDRAHPALRNKN